MKHNTSPTGEYAPLSRIAKALAHPTRLFLVDQLAGGEMCVCELKELIDADLSTVSRHLLTLKQAGIITDRRQGTQVFYRIRSARAMKALAMLAAIAREEAEERLSLIRR